MNAAADKTDRIGFSECAVRPGEKAQAELYEMRCLAVGKPAPNTKGADRDGQPLQLSDYRGKVVLLYFW